MQKKSKVSKQKIKLSPREQRLKRLYGLEPGEYEKIFEYQGQVCAICGRPPKENKHLAVDHDHKNGLCRGILDWNCNKAIARFRDDPILLKNAAQYLEHPPAVIALNKKVFGVIGRVTNKRKRKRKKK